MALVLVSEMEDVDKWRRQMGADASDVDFRVWPDVGDPDDVVMIAVDYNGIRAEVIAMFPHLECIAFLGHGAGDLLDHPARPSGVQVMRLRDSGLIRTMVEYVVLYVLRDLRFEPLYVEQQRGRVWREHEPRWAPDVAVGVMGLGSVGKAVACRLRDFEFEVSGWARSRHDIEGVSCYKGRDTLKAFLRPLDYVVCVLPLTRETRGLINADTIAEMKKGAYFINVGRGDLVIERDLLDALDADHLSGAALDVFCVEPLPPDSPFWGHRKVMVTPHESGARVENPIPPIVDNYRRLVAGEPLVDIADPVRGY
jgi:glyoxylate/hydroxypyruvate reductase A